jgi:CheY-like chemotaxis protein
MRVLVVEDDPTTLEGWLKALRQAGHEAEHAGNGLGALSFMELWAPDAIILDLVMPGMGGVEFLERMRQRVQWQHVYVVVTTALPDPDIPRGLGPLSVVLKPVGPDAVLEILAANSRPQPPPLLPPPA